MFSYGPANYGLLAGSSVGGVKDRTNPSLVWIDMQAKATSDVPECLVVAEKIPPIVTMPLFLDQWHFLHKTVPSALLPK